MSLKPKGIIHPSHPVANGVFPIQVSPVFPSPIVPIIKDQKSSTPLQHHQAICQAGMRNSSGRNQQHYRLFDEEIFENAGTDLVGIEFVNARPMDGSPNWS